MFNGKAAVGCTEPVSKGACLCKLLRFLLQVLQLTGGVIQLHQHNRWVPCWATPWFDTFPPAYQHHKTCARTLMAPQVNTKGHPLVMKMHCHRILGLAHAGCWLVQAALDLLKTFLKHLASVHCLTGTQTLQWCR